MNEARSQTGILSWTNYRLLTQVEDTTARKEFIIKFPFVTNAIAVLFYIHKMCDCNMKVPHEM